MSVDAVRVLMTADAVGGVWTYATELARALVPRGVHVTLATMGPKPTEAQLAALAEPPAIDVVMSDYRLEWMDDPWRDVDAAGEWLLDLEQQIAPHVVHLNGYAHAALPFAAPVLVAGHSCLASWDAAIPDAIDREKLEAYIARVKPALRRAAHVVAPSAAMLRELQRHYGPLDHASVIPNGRSPHLFQPADKEPFVFSAGRLWDRAKNVDAVASVAVRLRWPVAIAGPAVEPTHAASPSAGAPAHVRMLGALDPAALRSWLARAAVFALPARYEPFGLLPLEAALSGCALVLGDIPSLREVWGEAATFVPPDDHDALHAAIAALVEAPAKLREQGAAAQARAWRYGVDVLGRCYAELYSSLRAAVEAPGDVACAS